MLRYASSVNPEQIYQLLPRSDYGLRHAFPDSVPELTVIFDALLVNETLYVPGVASQTPFPAVKLGNTQSSGSGQATGDVIVVTVVPHPLVELAVTVTSVPTAIPVIVFRMIVPALAVTSPLLLKVTSYVAPLQTPALAVNAGAVVLGAFTTTVDAGHVPDAGVTVKVTSVPEAIPFTIFPDKLPALFYSF